MNSNLAATLGIFIAIGAFAIGFIYSIWIGMALLIANLIFLLFMRKK